MSDEINDGLSFLCWMDCTLDEIVLAMAIEKVACVIYICTNVVVHGTNRCVSHKIQQISTIPCIEMLSSSPTFYEGWASILLLRQHHHLIIMANVVNIRKIKENEIKN